MQAKLLLDCVADIGCEGHGIVREAVLIVQVSVEIRSKCGVLRCNRGEFLTTPTVTICVAATADDVEDGDENGDENGDEDDDDGEDEVG